MKVLIVGLPYFAKFIANKLSDNFPRHQFIQLDTYYSKQDKFRYLYHVLNADIVYSINGATSSSSVIDIALKLKKKIIFHWVGSDLLLAKEAYKENKINKNYIEKVTHITDTPWFVDDLKSIGINSTFLPLSVYEPQLGQNYHFPKEFSVLTYIKEGNENFYGMADIIELALRRPEIHINIAGMTKYSEPLPSNITLLGWVTNMAKIILENHVCIRIPKHDGLSFFVIESLALGRYVIYNQLYDHCEFISSNDDLLACLDNFRLLFESNSLPIHQEAIAFVQSNYSESKVLLGLMDVFKNK